jgi:SM-20-related protein
MLPDLELDAFRAQPLSREPFAHLVVPAFVKPHALTGICADYPKVSGRGSFPVRQLAYGPAFETFLAELESDEFRHAFEEKFGLDLVGRPTTTTVRGWCDARDGKIHTDSVGKIITVLIYMNFAWQNPGGRLRLLRSSDDLNDMLLEVPPIGGTLLAFKRADNSWHGHEPFEGERRVIQFNWVKSERNKQITMLRHHASSVVKRTFARLLPVRH